MGAYASALHVLGRFEEAGTAPRESPTQKKAWSRQPGGRQIHVRLGQRAGKAPPKIDRSRRTVSTGFLAMQTAKHGEKDRDVLSYKMSLGKTLYEQGKYDLALELIRKMS